MKYKNFRLPILIIILATGILLGTQIQRVFSGDSLVENLQKFNDVLTFTQKFYIDEVDTQKMVEAAINGMLEDLDPHSVYIPARQMETVQEEFRGDFEGIGIEFQVLNDTLTVVTPITGGPSEELGIQAGDRIVKIDGEDIIGIKNDDVRKKLRGAKGTKVVVSVHRIGVKEILDYEIIRDKIPLYSVDTRVMLDDKTGYISISRFAEKTTDEFLSALKDLSGKGMKQLILDLRNNPGGYLNQAVNIADLFIAGNKKLVYTKGRRPEFNEEFSARNPSPYEKMPIIVLINKGSASASEIVSGAIQDWDRGLIIGETSFGKGLVQRQFSLSDGSALRLTISSYFTPSGRLIQRKYDDKKKYYEDIAEFQEEEGENFDHEADKDSSRPVFKTGKGRTVYGGGGITPDFIVKNDRLTGYSSNLIRKNIFYQFALQYIDGNGAKIKSVYKDNLAQFLKEFQVDDQMLAEFTSFAATKELKMVDEEYQKDKEFVAARLKAQIARNYWKNEGWYSVLLGQDKPVMKAMTLFGKAKEIAGL